MDTNQVKQRIQEIENCIELEADGLSGKLLEKLQEDFLTYAHSKLDELYEMASLIAKVEDKTIDIYDFLDAIYDECKDFRQV